MGRFFRSAGQNFSLDMASGSSGIEACSFMNFRCAANCSVFIALEHAVPVHVKSPPPTFGAVTFTGGSVVCAATTPALTSIARHAATAIVRIIMNPSLDVVINECAMLSSFRSESFLIRPHGCMHISRFTSMAYALVHRRSKSPANPSRLIRAGLPHVV